MQCWTRDSQPPTPTYLIRLTPTYLGLTLDKSLVYHHHLKKSVAQSVLDTTHWTWGTSTHTLKLQSMPFSIQQQSIASRYVITRPARVGLTDNPLHTSKLLYIELIVPNTAVTAAASNHLISVRREVTARLMIKVDTNKDLPIHDDINWHPPVLETPNLIGYVIWKTWKLFSWRDEWVAADVTNQSSSLSYLSFCPLGLNLLLVSTTLVRITVHTGL